MFEFKLPDLGEGIHEGEVLKWHVAVGEKKQAGFKPAGLVMGGCLVSP